MAHILLVWGGLGFLGEGWLRLIFSASKISILGYFFLIVWIVATLSPIVGLISTRKVSLQPWYLGLVALTMFVIWFNDYMREMRLFYYDPL